MNHLLMNMTWKEYRDKVDNGILILPVGSTEQHGPHLPIGVDTIIATQFSLAIAQEVNAVVAPTVSYGYKSLPASGGGPMFPGTIDLNGSTLTSLVYDLLKEFVADGWKKILIFSAHYENEAFLSEACDLLLRNQTKEFPKILICNWWDNLSAGTMSKVFDEVKFPGWALEHAAISETSLMMHFSPELVYEDLITDEGMVSPPTYQCFPPSKSLIPPSGCLHSAQSSSSEKGKLIVEDATKNIVTFLKNEFSLDLTLVK
ncbi:creatininase [Bacillus salipaludis]|uniref:creatininase n=1 Tax=Bacillus salipaludis TaxID=2547811 RepID=UPI002E1B00E2|nr:creatininase [Bacillus salipaludis]